MDAPSREKRAGRRARLIWERRGGLRAVGRLARAACVNPACRYVALPFIRSLNSYLRTSPGRIAPLTTKVGVPSILSVLASLLVIAIAWSTEGSAMSALSL